MIRAPPSSPLFPTPTFFRSPALPWLPTGLGDPVPRLDAGPRRGTAVLHAAHQDPGPHRQTELLGELRGDRLHGKAERGPPGGLGGSLLLRLGELRDRGPERERLAVARHGQRDLTA